MNKTIYLFRHGQTDWNLAGKMQGHRDIPLNETGKNEAYQLKEKIDLILKDSFTYEIHSSDLSRAFETAKVSFPDTDIRTNQGLREIDVGDMEEKSRDSVSFSFQNPDPNYRFPGGESIREHRQRIYSTIEEILRTDKEVIFISTHGGSMARFLEQTLNYQPKKIKNCELVHIERIDQEYYFKGYLS